MKRLLLALTMFMITACAYSQGQGIVSDLNHLMQTWEQYESLYRQAKSLRRTQTTDLGTIVHRGWDNRLKSLTWGNLKMEDRGDCIRVYRPKGNGWEYYSVIDKDRCGNHSYNVLSESRRYGVVELKVTVIVLSDYVGVEVKPGNRSGESYNFK